jgi:putative protease
MKSAEYVGCVVAAYRYLMDHYREDRKGSVAAAKRMLASDFARNKTTYWYGFRNVRDGVEQAGNAILNPDQAGGTGIYLGLIDTLREPDRQPVKTTNTATPGSPTDPEPVQMALIRGGSYDPDPGDSIRLHKKDDTGRVSHKVRTVQTDEKGNRWIDIPVGFSHGDSVYLLQTKSMSKRYPRVLPNDISSFRRQPGPERLPVLDLTAVKKNELSYFPEGLYVQVSTVSDLFTVQSAHPVRIILELNSETVPDLLAGKTVLPFPKKQIVLSLDPFCPAGTEDTIRDMIEKLSEAGYMTWIANNIAHLALLRGKNVRVIAGPYLYTFNRWAVSWLENQGIGAFISPLENSRQNIEATFERSLRQRVMLTVFAYPALFRIRFRLPESYDFTFFSDKEDMNFKVNSTPDGSFVMPEDPFSIVDKVDFMHSAGFSRFLIDFSKTKVSKGLFKQVMNAFYRHQVLPGTSRFNWKDGFYSPEQLEEYRLAGEKATLQRSPGTGRRSSENRNTEQAGARSRNDRNSKRNTGRK